MASGNDLCVVGRYPVDVWLSICLTRGSTRTLAFSINMTQELKTEIEKSSKIQFCKGLRGRVFHVTYAKNLDAIKKQGEVLVNSDSSLATTFGDSQNSFYRLRGCVSVFDYESPTSEKWQEHMWKCNPLSANGVDELAFLFLSEKAKNNLYRWNEAKEHWVSERVVPHVEAGHRGNIPISEISEILVVKMMIDKESLAYKLVQGRRNANK